MPPGDRRTDAKNTAKPDPEKADVTDTEVAALPDAEAAAGADTEDAAATAPGAVDATAEPAAGTDQTVPAEPPVAPSEQTLADVSAHDAAVASYRRNNPGAGLEE